MRRRWPLGLAALLGFLLLGSMLVAVFKGARVKGSVPGSGAILGLAVTGEGFVIGTADGVLISADGSTWTAVDGFAGGSLAASAGADAVVWNSGKLYRSSGLEDFTHYPPELQKITALTGGAGGTVYAAGPGEVFRIQPGRPVSSRSFDGGPPEILALAVGEGSPPGMLAGDLSSGLWLSEDNGESWSRILETPIRAVLLDRAEPGRRFIGTAGGVLWSTQTEPWQFTDLRVPVEALAQTPDGYFAITGDRLLFESADGLAWKVRSPETG